LISWKNLERSTYTSLALDCFCTNCSNDVNSIRFSLDICSCL